MFIIYAIPIGFLVGLLLGGRPGVLAGLPLRFAWVALAGYVFQSLLFVPRVGALAGDARPALYVATQVLVVAALLANRRIRGMPLVAAGAVLNLVAIAANGGFMPADRAAYAALGMSIDGYWNTAFVDHPRLAVLGDWIALPAWLPLANVVSIGDGLIAIGVAAVIAMGMVPQAASLPANGPPAAAGGAAEGA